jgi:preprotein translocase subunit SecF
MFIIKYRKIFFLLTTVIVVLAIGAVAVLGLNVGIDFKGGAILEVSYSDNRPDKGAVYDEVNAIENLGGFSVREIGESGYVIRTRSLAEEEREMIMTALSLENTLEVEQERFNSIGPVIGDELRRKAYAAIAVVILAIIFFIAFAFRHVSRPVSSWKYGVVAIIALLHDIMIPLGVFAVLGTLFGAEIDVLFVMALLAILGYSVNDTIVVFDRVRENLKINHERGVHEDFELVVGKSLNQTYARSINTSLTTLFVLLALFFVGAPATQNFALVLITGVLAGTYSSLALASPLLVSLEKRKSK